MDERFLNRIKRANSFEKLIKIVREAAKADGTCTFNLGELDRIEASLKQHEEMSGESVQTMAKELKEANHNANIKPYVETCTQEGKKSTIHPGQAIVLVGYPGLLGTQLLADHHFDKLGERFTSRFIETECAFGPEFLGQPDITSLANAGVSDIIPVNEGGLNKALYTLAKRHDKGFLVKRNAVPVKQVTIEFCEFFDLDPWSMLSNGCIIVCEKANIVKDAINKSVDKNAEANDTQDMLMLPCVTIGYISEDKKMIILHDGEESLLNRPSSDGLLEIIKQELIHD